MAYRSRGVVLVVGDDPSILDCARDLARTLSVVVFAPGAQSGDPRRNPVVVGGKVTALEGWLGEFRAKARGKESNVDIGALGPNEDGTFDLVLDLHAVPLLRRSVPPPGYFAPAAGELGATLEAIRALVGAFAKPRFFDYRDGLCTHGAQGIPGCTRCLSVCGAGAIRSDGDRIAVDPHLCQGCAACALACPTGALSFAHPSRMEIHERLESAIAGFRTAGRAPLVLAHARAEAAPVEALAGTADCMAFETNPLAAFGEELWFAALAAGARGVVLVLEAGAPRETREQLAERVSLARRILAVAGISEDAVRLAPASALAHLALDIPPPRPLAPGGESGTDRKRRMLADALLRLASTEASAPIALGPGAPFGAVSVDRARCTLCSACANLCPTGALGYGADGTARLAFREEDCVQCGICAAACPEHAVALIPRATPSRERRTARLLHEGDLARCPRCGKPFMPARLLAASIAKVTTRMALTAAAEERMRWCPDCRQQSP